MTNKQSMPNPSDSATEHAQPRQNNQLTEPRRGGKRRILKKSSGFLLKFVVVLLSLATFLLATPVGTKLTITAINSLEMLDIEHQSGTALGDLTLDKFTLTLDELTLELTNTTVNLHLRCLWRHQLCVDSIKGERFVLNINNEEPPSVAPFVGTRPNDDISPALSKIAPIDNLDNDGVADEALIDIPYFYRISALEFAHAEVNVDQVHIATSNLFASGDVGGADILLRQVAADSLIIDTEHRLEAQPQEKQPTEQSAASDDWPFANLPEISLPLNLVVDNLKVDAFSLNQIEQQYLPQQVHTKFHWQAKLLSVDHFNAAVSSVGDIKSAANYMFGSPYSGNISADVAIKHRVDLALLNNANYQIALNGPLNNLSVAIETNSRLHADVSARIDLLNNQLPFTGEINISDFSSLELKLNELLDELVEHPDEANQLAELKSGQISVSGDISSQAIKGQLALANDQYQQGNIEFQLRHTLTEHSTKQTLTLNSLRFNDAATNSDLQLSATAEIALAAKAHGETQAYFDEITWRGNITSNNFILPSQMPAVKGDIHGELIASGTVSPQKAATREQQATEFDWQIDAQHIDVDGKLNAVPFQLEGYISLDDQLTIHGADLFVDAVGTQIHLNGYAQDAWFIDGSIVSEDLTFIDPKLSGKTSSSFSINGSLEQPKIALTTRAIDLAYQASIHDEFHFDDLSIDLIYQPLQNHIHQVNLESKKFRHNHMAFKGLFASLSGDLANQVLNANWQGETAGNLMVSGKYDSAKEQLSIWLDQAELQYLGYLLMPTSRVALTYDVAQHQLYVTEHCWLGDGSSLCFDDQNTLGTNGELNALIAVDASAFNQSLYPESLLIDTKLNGTFATKWQQDKAPTFDINLNVDQGNIQHTLHDDKVEVVTWQSGVIQLQVDENQLLHRFTLTQASSEPLINIISFVDLTKRELPLTGKVEINELSLRPLKAFAPDVDDLDARLGSKLTLSGTLRDPYLTGDISLDAKSLTFNRSKNHIKGLVINTKLDGSTAIVEGAMHVDQDPVFIDATLNWQQAFNATGNVKTQQVSLSLPPNVDVTFSPNINFEYHKDILRLSGTIEVLEGLLALEKLPQDTVNVSEDTIIVDDNGKAIVKESRLGIYSNIDVVFNDKFKLSGYGFNGNLSGKLQLEQTAYQPMQLHGLLNVNNGIYQAYGQQLKVTSGKVTFNGSPKNPFVDFRAERYIKSDDVHAGITISGLTNALEINLFSTPTKPQPEILSYLIRGRGIDEGTGNTAALGIALGTSLTKASNITEALNKLPIFHNVALDTEIDGDQTQATISGYIGERLYLKYGIGIEKPIDEVTVRFYLLNQLWLETVSGIQKSADIYYSFDVD